MGMKFFSSPFCCSILQTNKLYILNNMLTSGVFLEMGELKLLKCRYICMKAYEICNYIEIQSQQYDNLDLWSKRKNMAV